MIKRDLSTSARCAFQKNSLPKTCIGIGTFVTWFIIGSMRIIFFYYLVLVIHLQGLLEPRDLQKLLPVAESCWFDAKKCKWEEYLDTCQLEGQCPSGWKASQVFAPWRPTSCKLPQKIWTMEIVSKIWLNGEKKDPPQFWLLQTDVVNIVGNHLIINCSCICLLVGWWLDYLPPREPWDVVKVWEIIIVESFCSGGCALKYFKSCSLRILT